MSKLFAGTITGEIYNHLEENDLLLKGCHRNIRGTKDQLLIDKGVIKNCKRRKVELIIIWIDYQKAYYMVLHSWIKKPMEMCEVANKIFHLLSKCLESQQTTLMLRNEYLARVNIERRIFQGDSIKTLSHLLFVIDLIPLGHTLRKVNAGYRFEKGQHKKVNLLLFISDLKLNGNSEKETERLTNKVRTFPKDIDMQFCMRKCVHVAMKPEKPGSVGRMEISSGEVIQKLESDKGYNAQVFWKLTTIRDSAELKSGNTVRVINSRAASLVKYSAGILKWSNDYGNEQNVPPTE